MLGSLAQAKIGGRDEGRHRDPSEQCLFVV